MDRLKKNLKKRPSLLPIDCYQVLAVNVTKNKNDPIWELP